MKKKIHFEINRISILLVFFGLIFVYIVTRLFYLQVIKHDYFLQVAAENHIGITKLPARRGEILLEDSFSGNKYKLATTTTYNLLYADPAIISKDGTSEIIANKIAPIIFDIDTAREEENRRIKKLQIKETSNVESEETNKKSDQELLNEYTQKIKTQMETNIREQILLIEKIDPELEKEINKLNIEGIEIDENKNLYAYPKKIASTSKTAKKLYELINIDKDSLQRLLEGKNHYSVLAKKLSQEKNQQIENLLKENPDTFRGLRVIKEHYRYYPEGSLSSQVLGYVNSAGVGQYGIEGRFNQLLVGKSGFIESQKDATGAILTVGDSKVQIAEDGANITLTIDRAVQLEVEKNLVAAVDDYQAEAAQAIVINPKTGQIIAIANYPTFNPNDYGNVFKLKEISLTQQEIDNLTIIGEGSSKKMYYYLNRNPDRRFEVFEDEEIPGTYYRYDNFLGSEVYRNKAITDLYEPGSTFKVITMSSAIDASEVEPNSTHYCGGAIKVPKIANPKSDKDYFSIKTFNNEYHGIETMTQVLENSCNIGMSHVAEKLGANLFYNYIKKFGYGQKTGIEFDNENNGQVEHFEYWDQSELLTKSFGQGLSVTLIQHAAGLAALANKGALMQPYIVKKIEYANGKNDIFEPRLVDQVITKETADKITSMMISVTQNGQAKKAQVEGHFVAGKTGTSQTYKNGQALTGVGTTITSFVGFGPVNDPEFLVLVKVDRPLNGPYAESSAVPIAQKILEFLFKYYNISPDKK